MSRTKQNFFSSVREGIKSEAYDKIIIALKSFLFGFLCSRATIFESASPFGIAYIAAIDFKAFNSYFALAGVIFGYLIEGMRGIRYILVSISIYALKTIVRKKYNNNSTIFFAISSGVMLLVVGIIEASTYNMVFYDMLLIFASCILCSSFVYFFNKATPFFTNSSSRSSGLTERELISVIITLSVMVLSFNTVYVAGISLGKTLGVFIVLIASFYGGMPHGSMAGVIVGLIMSFGSGNGTHIVGSFSFGGLLAGVFSDMGRIGVSVAFLIANSVLTMYFNGSSEVLISIYEILISSTLFFLLPEKFMKKIASFLLLSKNDEKLHPQKFKDLFLNRLRCAASSFSELSETISAVGTQKKEKEVSDIPLIIGATADTICKKCRSCMFCWGTAFNDTMGIFNDLSSIFAKKGKIEKEELPPYFAKRCEKNMQIISELNLRLTEHFSIEREEMKIEENRTILAQQYSGVSQIMENIAKDLGNAVKFDSISEDRIINYLTRNKIKNPNVSCYTDADGLFTVEASAVLPYEMPEIKQFVKDISSLVGICLDLNFMNEDGGIWQTKLIEKEDFSIGCAKASYGKDGKTICGDTSSSFRAEGGKYIMTISDGMGSGVEAKRDSMLTVSFLEKLLKSGFDKESALKLVNSALILKSKDESFATVDITVINLVSGVAEFIKAGAAPTFIKRGSSVYELGCNSLPAGILADASFEKSKCKLKENDMIIMASDGVTAIGSKAISKLASEFCGNEPSELAEYILNQAMKLTQTSDDMTVSVGFFSKK